MCVCWLLASAQTHQILTSLTRHIPLSRPARHDIRETFSHLASIMISNRPENYPAEGQDAAQMSCKIYVGNLAWATDENALGSHFTTIGEVKGAVVMRSEGRSRGFGFVTFAAPEQAKRAIDTMYDSELIRDLLQRTIRCS
ncbi:hypothetical protein H4Q26_002480 [Puccinia striiformis f. sp. tritici PST-130]|nr:hypothetical protein H4Q26_002480 [Puccinia striiformis f. sp. tritici PST-130]